MNCGHFKPSSDQGLIYTLLSMETTVLPVLLIQKMEVACFFLLHNSVGKGKTDSLRQCYFFCQELSIRRSGSTFSWWTC